MRRVQIIFPAVAAAALLAGAPLAAQEADTAANDPAPQELPREPTPEGDTIVVTGEQAKRPRVIVGSRIPRRPILVGGPIATSTGTPGLVPQSGMDPAGRYTRITRTRDCVSDDLSISKAAACIMADAQEAYAKGDLAGADGRYSVITGSNQFPAGERLAAARWQYRIADETGDLAGREYALLLMVATGEMELEQDAIARRTLVSWSLQRGDRSGAQERLRELDETGLSNANDLANWAILLRELGAIDLPETATDIMRRAIALREREGQMAGGATVPAGWRDFAASV